MACMANQNFAPLLYLLGSLLAKPRRAPADPLVAKASISIAHLVDMAI
jgi:hypothetical protein